MTADHIPFVNSQQDADLVTRIYPDSPKVRISIDTKMSVLKSLPQEMELWVDAGVDSFQNPWPPNSASLRNILGGIDGCNELAMSSFQEKPKPATVQTFVSGLLDACNSHNPTWLSVPQLPVPRDSSRNAWNRQLAKATGEWRVRTAFKGELILPIILTHDEQVHFKAKRGAILKQAMSCRDLSGAEGVWVVVVGLDDQSGSQTNEKKRFPGLVAFHQELRKVKPSSTFVIAGPYWGLNLVLWARGLVEYPAIGVGSGFRYFISGGPLMPAKTRVAVTPIRRLTLASPGLVGWLEEAEKSVPKGAKAAQEFEKLRKALPHYMRNKEAARRQVAESYHEWIAKLEQSPEAGRALALYQDLSAAYVVGKGVGKALPKDDVVTKADRIAQQLMMFCL
jgi:hypothetical protein